ncbi:MAG: flagellar assembly protein FliW [Thermotogota bacterium]
MAKYKTKLGEIEIDNDKILKFEFGLPGFDDLTKYTLVTPEETKPIMWLVSLEDTGVAFPVIHPEMIRYDYHIDVPSDIVEYLQIEQSDQAITLSILSIPEDQDKITANLVAPIIISTINNKGIQFMSDTEEYSTRHYIKDEMKRNENILKNKEGD